jgi:hypothetical protein
LRREAKGYGLRKLIEGPPIVPGVTAVVIDDVLGSGSSSSRTVRALRNQGAVPVAVVTIVDIGRDARRHITGIKYETLFTARDLGLSAAPEPPPSSVRGWALRGVHSPIPATRPIRPVFSKGGAFIVGDRCGVLAVDRRGRLRRVEMAAPLCASSTNDTVVLGNSTAVRAMDPDSLLPLWTIDLGARAVCCTENGDVYVARDDKPEVLRVDAGSGVVMATVTLSSCADALEIMGDALIVATETEVLALERSLTRRWGCAEPMRSMVASDEGLFVLTQHSTLCRLDPRTGTALWSRRVGGCTLPQLAAIGDGVAYAVESVVVCLSGAGTTLWVRSGSSRIVAGPVACGASTMAVGDNAGFVRTLRSGDGGYIASYAALPLRPIALAGSPSTVVGVGVDGDVWGIDLMPQA